jgi:PAS domain S-box-containing protein
VTPQDRKQKGNILVIDDEPANLDLLTTILTEQGYAVCPANDGESGLQLVKCRFPDLVLVDISMHGMNGYQVCTSLKNDPATRNIPLILIVPISHTINQPKAMLSGSVDYIASPFDAQEVLWRVETHISLHRLRANLESAVRGRAAEQTESSEELERALRETLALTRITGRKHAEEKIRERESELRQVLDLAPQHIAVLGPDGSRLFANQASLDYYGLTLESWRGCDPGRFLHPDDLERMARVAQDAESSSPSAHDAEVRLLRKDGTYRWFLVRRKALLDGRGDLLRWYVAATDIEDHKQAEEERERLRQAQADLAHTNRVSTMGELTASLAHEIKQPIFAAVTNAETCLQWLGRDQPDLAEARQAASRLIKDVTRASGIISRISLLFKKDVLPRELVDVNELIREMILLLQGEAARYSISIHGDLAIGLPQILADRVGFQQVLMNLMLNGIEAMKQIKTPGKLTIKSQQDENRQIVVSVTDTGVGLPQEHSEQIFGAFFTTKAQGTGMGLPISRSIIESHGGRLWAAPNSGPGATFQFALPLDAKTRDGRVAVAGES